MHHRTTKVALAAVLVIAFVLGLSGTALAQWPDLTLSILGDYGITEAEVAAISDGYTDGTWKPYTNVTRQQFVKMAVDAYQIPLANPATPTYTDVPATSDYYMYIEAATAAGLTNGVGGGLFDPKGLITREQAAAIIARWVADKNGYDLDTMYSAAEISAILGAYPDAAQVGPSLQAEMAFAVDFGIVWGNAMGNLAPKANMTRIQGAAMLIRSWSIIPDVTPPVPADIELVSDDEAENLIGLTHQYTYKVTDAAGDPIEGVLVDFDTLMADWYVGNVQPAAGMTDANGEITVNLISTEPGIQRISAAAPGLLAIWSTKYWVALDEVFIIDEDRDAQNNAGTTHSWEAQVMVFGPGPLSTATSDWYNLYVPGADPADVDDDDAIDWFQGDDYSYADMVAWEALGYVARSLEGIPVTWEIVNVVDDDPDTDEDETVPSVGDIVAAEFDATIAADGQSADAFTDAAGTTSIDISSDVIGDTVVIVTADYVGNPYEGQLFDHDTFQYDTWWHNQGWDDQPAPYAWAWKTWIPHVIGGDEGPIDPAYTEANIGEEFFLTITLVDVYGNPIEGRQVEWFMQGIGHFVTDDDNTVTDPTNPDGNRDLDLTDAAGQAWVMVKSFDMGEQIVHAKVRDKGINGNEGQFLTYTAEVQWFDVDIATFDDIWTNGEYDDLDTNEAWSQNPVGDSHEYTLHVYGLKLEYDPWWQLNLPGLHWNQTPYIDTDYAGSSYDGVFDWKDAEYFGGILMAPPYLDDNGDGIIDADEAGTDVVTCQGRTMVLTFVGGYTSYDWNMDGYKEAFEGIPGIYLPLEGKDVTFDLVDNNIGMYFDENGLVESVGSFSPDSDVTDANGEATVTVTSNEKGPQTVEATVDWEGNPHNMSELVQAYAKKIWVAGDAVTIVVSVDGEEVANNEDGEVASPINPVWTDPDDFTPPEAIDPNTGRALNYAHIEVHVYDEFGNDLPDYEVVYLLENVGTTLIGSQGAEDTYLPYAYFTDHDPYDEIDGVAYDTNGPLPDSSEPSPEDDPYAPIVGDGYMYAFYFNQWLGAGSWSAQDVFPTILPEFPFIGKNVLTGRGFYWDFIAGMYTHGERKIEPKQFAGFNDYNVHGVGLITDGAKAWTRDGYYREPLEWADTPWGEFPVVFSDDIWPNLMTGSNIDVQLAENPEDGNPFAGHYKSIVKVMVYAPADGLVYGGTPIWHYQIHKVWEVPVPTTLTVAPALDYAVAGLESSSITATVLDQFGDPMMGVPITLRSEILEGDAVAGPNGGWVWPADAAGISTWTWGQALGAWGVERVWAEIDSPGYDYLESSNESIIQWVYRDGAGVFGDIIDVPTGQTRVYVDGGLSYWVGKTNSVFLTPTSASLGSLAYDQTVYPSSIMTTRNWAATDTVYVNATPIVNTDGIVNWVFDLPYTIIP